MWRREEMPREALESLAARGWARFPHEPAVEAWARHADRAAAAAEADPAFAEWRRCRGAWFVGVNALSNDETGRLPGGPPLTGAAVAAARAMIGAPFAFDRAQASICREGYPRKGEEESDAAFAFRRDRDAAHVDGLLRVMPGRRRRLKEAHGFILGLPLNDAPEGGAPFVIWEGSHRIMAEAFRAALAGTPARDWPGVDLTDAYRAARRRCFETCRRVEIAARPGEAYLVHRHALHGVAPWRGGPGRRAVAYFRPDPFPGAGFGWWLDDPIRPPAPVGRA